MTRSWQTHNQRLILLWLFILCTWLRTSGTTGQQCFKTHPIPCSTFTGHRLPTPANITAAFHVAGTGSSTVDKNALHYKITHHVLCKGLSAFLCHQGDGFLSPADDRCNLQKRPADTISDRTDMVLNCPNYIKSLQCRSDIWFHSGFFSAREDTFNVSLHSRLNV